MNQIADKFKPNPFDEAANQQLKNDKQRSENVKII